MSAMDPLRKVMGAVDGFQRRFRWVGVPYAVQKKFGDDNANLVVVALAWYGFTAIFPLLLVVVTIFKLIGAAALGDTLLHTLQEFPVIGSDFKASSDQSLNGSTIGLVVGLLGLIYGVQGVTQTAQLAMATVWNIPQDQRTGFLPRPDYLGGQQGEGSEVEQDVDHQQAGDNRDPDRVVAGAAGGVSGNE